MTNDDVDDTFEFRRSWPFSLGALGGLIFGIGALFLLCGALTRPGPHAQHALFAMGLGSAILAVAWLGMLCNGAGGTGPMLGSLAFAVGIAFLFAYRHDPTHLKLKIQVIVMGFAAFSLGHMFVRRLAATSVAAAVAFVAIAVEYIAGGNSGLGVLTTAAVFGGLTVVGVSLAFTLPALGHRPA